MSSKWIIFVGGIFLVMGLFIAGCSDDDGTGPEPYEGANYKITADFEVSDSRDPDSIFVEVERLNADVDPADEATVVIDSVTLGLSDYDPYTDIATYGTDDITIESSGTYSFSFSCDEDSAGGDFTAPPSTRAIITSPRIGEGDTTYPAFAEGAPIPITWEYDGDTPRLVTVILSAFQYPNLLEFEVDLPGDETFYTVPAGTTNGFGGEGWPMPMIYVLPKDSVIIATDDVEINIGVDGIGDISIITLLDTDTTGGYTTPTITVTGDPGSKVISWDPPIGSMGLAVYRNTENHGQGYTGMIWNVGANDPFDGFTPPVSYGVLPSDAWGSDPDEAIIAGEEYTVMVTWLFEEGVGATGFCSW